ncbi:MAG: hypothetical protein HW390_1153 [Candidatus Brocadiaceae bacterium]|nr:hypothetical protein [Candidatus Brocadiaceae bacterium]
MLFSEPHLVKGNKDVCAEAEDEEDAGKDRNGYEVGAHVPDKPRGREVQQDAAKGAGINRYLQPFTRVGHGHDTGKDKYHDGDGEDMGMRRSQKVTISLLKKQTLLQPGVVFFNRNRRRVKLFIFIAAVITLRFFKGEARPVVVGKKTKSNRDGYNS